MSVSTTETISGILSTWTGGAFDWSSGHGSRYGKCWNGQEIKEVYLGCCCHTVPSLPATPEERVQAALWQAKVDAHQKGLKDAREEWTTAHALEKGKRVQVRLKPKGRQVKNAGKTGIVMFLGSGVYGDYARIAFDDKTEDFSKPEYLLVASPFWVEETFVPAEGVY